METIWSQRIWLLWLHLSLQWRTLFKTDKSSLVLSWQGGLECHCLVPHDDGRQAGHGVSAEPARTSLCSAGAGCLVPQSHSLLVCVLGRMWLQESRLNFLWPNNQGAGLSPRYWVVLRALCGRITKACTVLFTRGRHCASHLIFPVFGTLKHTVLTCHVHGLTGCLNCFLKELDGFVSIKAHLMCIRSVVDTWSSTPHEPHTRTPWGGAPRVRCRHCLWLRV